MRYANRVAILLVVLALFASACTADSGDSSGEAEGAATTEVAGTEPSGSEFAGQTLLVWTKVAATPAIDEVYAELTSEFEDEWDVTVTTESKSFDDLKATVILALGQSDGPDVAVVPQGRPDMGKAVEAGLLLDLTSFSNERGWPDAFGASTLTKTMFSSDGVEFGTGNVYGISPEVEFLGWFYNKTIFSDVGVEPPATIDDLEALLATLAAAGETPLNAGNVEGFPFLHTFMSAANADMSVEYVNDLIYGRNDKSFDTDATQTAAARLVDWVDAGYFTPAFEGIAYGDSIGQFASGNGAIMQTGTWIIPDLDPATFGFFLTPAIGGGIGPQPGATSEPFAVRADTSVPDLAKEYIDWMMSERAAELLAEAGALTTRTVDAPGQSALAAEAQAAWGLITSSDQLGHYLDWASPTMFDTMVAESQRMIAGDITADEFVKALDADYQAFLSGQ